MKRPLWKKIKRNIKKVYSFLPFRKPFCCIVKYLKIPLGDFYKYLWFKGEFLARVKGRSLKLYHYGDAIENDIFWKGDHLPEMGQLEIWMKLCEVSNVIFDIGANTGLYSLTAKLVNPRARVIAFEPAVNTYHKLCKNIQINGFDILAEEIAISNRTGQQIFYDAYGEHQYSASLSPDKLKNAEWFKEPIKEYLVRTDTLSNYISCHNINKVDLIKIDVELHEPEVLEGMGGYLWKFKPVLFVEILTEEIARKINRIFENSDYLTFHFDEVHKLVRVEKAFGNWEIPNFLFCTEKIAAFLGVSGLTCSR